MRLVVFYAEAVCGGGRSWLPIFGWQRPFRVKPTPGGARLPLTAVGTALVRALAWVVASWGLTGRSGPIRSDPVRDGRRACGGSVRALPPAARDAALRCRLGERSPRSGAGGPAMTRRRAWGRGQVRRCGVKVVGVA